MVKDRREKVVVFDYWAALRDTEEEECLSNPGVEPDSRSLP